MTSGVPIFATMRGGLSTPNPFLEYSRSQGVLMLDGGLATTLEARGFDLADELWSAKVLLEAPEAIAQVHYDFLSAGADCVATASYQASVEGFLRRGMERSTAIELLRLSIRLAVEARDAFWELPENRKGRLRPLVAASVGPYGAFLADGSEYSGQYGIDDDELYAFHAERWHLFAESPADLIACETIPSAREAVVLLQLLRETPRRQAWISFSCRDGEHLADGTHVSEMARQCGPVPNVVAVGVNCTRPEFIESLLTEMRLVTDKPLLAYPNSGEIYEVSSRTWGATPSPIPWDEAARRWVAAGARGVGGCCRVGLEQIAGLRTALIG